MPQEVILLKLGEIALKGLNRRSFEDVLLKNIRRRLQSAGEFSVSARQSTVYVVPENPQADLDLAEERVSKVFGVVGYARAGVCEKELDAICRRAAEYLAEELDTASTFKVECKRSDKKFPYKSPEVSAQVGGYLLEKFPHLQVDVHHPDLTVRVEVRELYAFVHADAKPGAGGIPVGTGGKAAVLISGGIDSPVASYMMAKRGIELVAVHFASPPYTSELAEMKVMELLKKVARYSGWITTFVVPFTEIQEQIRDKCPEEYFTIIMRRVMMMISARIAKSQNCHALITGESVGQVASQTMYALACTDCAADMPVFRPCIGMDKDEIIAISRKIDTFETSIEPYEDCCTVFTPKHPKTKPRLDDVLKAEANMENLDEMMDRAVAGVKKVVIK